MYKTFFDTKITLHGAANSDLAVYVVFLFMFFVVVFVFVVVVIVFVVSIYFPQSYFFGANPNEMYLWSLLYFCCCWCWC